MFTGLVEALGAVEEATDTGGGRRLRVREPALAGAVKVGDSVAVNGACLTVVDCAGGGLTFEVGPETLRLTNLGEVVSGDRVNLERSLSFGDRLGGHLVQGHIDGLGRVAGRRVEGDWETVWFTCPEALAEQMVRKGSIAVDGVSLTLVDVERDRFSVMLIPHTREHTTLGFKGPGSAVNLETDLLAKYVFKALQLRQG